MDDEKRCRSCRYWDTDLEWPVDNEIGECNSPKTLWGYEHSPKDLKPDEALIENDEGWGAYYGPLYGCVHWEAKH